MRVAFLSGDDWSWVMLTCSALGFGGKGSVGILPALAHEKADVSCFAPFMDLPCAAGKMPTLPCF